jgi:outer membrane immunogenic protein
MAVAAAAASSQRADADGIPYDGRRPVQLMYNWSGFYAGVHLGGDWGNTQAVDLNGYNAVGDNWDAETSGVMGGAQLGYNWQSGLWVVGVEGDLGVLGLSGSGSTNFPFVAGDTGSRTEQDFYMTVRGRLGYLYDNWLFYATGGYIGVDTQLSIVDGCTTAPPCGPASINASDKSFRSGWTIGGGIEAAMGGPWTLKAEYLYYDIDSRTVTGFANGGGAPFSWELDTHGNILRAGLNYRFGGY